MSKLFGTDGVRGLAGVELTPELAYKLGAYSGELLKSRNRSMVVLGRDTRLSGSMLKSALASGFMAVGVDVLDLGIVPTPMVAYIIKEFDYVGGAVVTASHNPYYDNGIKIFNEEGYKLSDFDEEEIECKIKNNAPIELENHDGIGRKHYGVAIKREYESHLKNIVDRDIVNLKIALDCGNGALSEIGPKVLEELGARVYSINTDYDGTNINDNCGSTNPNLISELVVEKKCDIGFSFDGDGDRVIAVDEKGNLLNGDHLLAVFAKYLKEKDKLSEDIVVGTVMSNLGLKRYLETIDVDFLATDVGDSNVLEGMIEKGSVLGGEQSGHIIFLESNTTGDGMAVALQLVNILLESKEKASELFHLVEDYPQVLLNASVPNDKKGNILEIKEISDRVAEIEEELGSDGRVNIRPSGTEPVVRVMIEGKCEDTIKKYAEELTKIIESKVEDEI